ISPLRIVARRLSSAAGTRRGPNVGAQMNPAHGLRHNAWSSINECINAKTTQFVAAGSYKQNVAYGLGDIQRPHEFEPASNASGAFAGASVQTATRCHHDQWWQGSITAIDFGSDNERAFALTLQELYKPVPF